MGTLIDSSVLIAAERGSLDLTPMVQRQSEEPVAIAAVTASELLHGVHRQKPGVRRARIETEIEALLSLVPVVPFDLPAARVHAMLSADLRARRQAVGAHDLMIAAIAVTLGFRVATRDRRSFPRIKGLDVVYW